MNRSFVTFLAVALITAMTPGFSVAADTGPPIRIGFVAPQTGPLALNGRDSLVAGQIATDIVDEEGGVAGRRVELDIVDAPTPDEAKAAVERLVTRDGIKVVLGTYGSSLALAAATTATRYGAFYWEQSSSSYKVVQDAGQYAVKMVWGPHDLATTAVESIKNLITQRLKADPKSMRIAIVHEDSAFGSDNAQYSAEELKAQGLNVIDVLSYNAASTSDFTPLILKLKSEHPDILLAAAYPNDAVLFQQQSKAQNFVTKAVIGLSAGYDIGAFGKALGAAADGIFTTDSTFNINDRGLSPKARSLTAEFIRRFSAKAGHPPASTASIAFSCTYAFLHYLLPKAPSMDRDQLLKAAMALDVPLGELPLGFGIKFTGNGGDRPHSNLRALTVLTQWRDGGTRQLAVAPDRFATASAEMIPLPPWADR